MMITSYNFAMIGIFLTSPSTFCSINDNTIKVGFMPLRGILSGLLTNQCVIVFRPPAAGSYESVEGLCSPAGEQNPSTLSRNRLACEPGQMKKQVVRTLDILL